MDYPQYWPAAEGSSVDFNGIVVSNKQVVTKTDYVITNLVVANTKVSVCICWISFARAGEVREQSTK